MVYLQGIVGCINCRNSTVGSLYMPWLELFLWKFWLQAELKLLGISNVGIHNLSPGMVTTELLMAGEHATYGKGHQMSMSIIHLKPASGI